MVRGVFADDEGQRLGLVGGTRHGDAAEGVKGVGNDDVPKALQALVGCVKVVVLPVDGEPCLRDLERREDLRKLARGLG